MKEGILDKDVFNSLFKELIKEKSRHGFCVIASRDFAKKLWEKYRVPYKAKARLVRQKMREWWNSYEWIRSSDLPQHKIICGVAVHLSQPMGYDYCAFEAALHGGIFSLIVVFQDQQRFFDLPVAPVMGEAAAT